jgi:nitrate reductase NapAB chaperone NapD
LNPKETHDCDSIFLKLFLNKIEEIKRKSDKSLSDITDNNFAGFEEDEKQLLQVSIEREKPAYGNIDIVIESKKWIIFIENKIENFEALNQVKAYCDWIESQNKEWLGIFLTKNGSPADSIKDNDYNKRVICLSYKHIISWLESCCTDKRLIYYPHIISALVQYINIINKNLNIMDNTEIEKIKTFLNDHRKDAAQLAEHFSDLKRELDQYIKAERDKFLDELKEKLEERLNGEKIENTKLKCNYNGIKFEITFTQEYPLFDEGGGRGLCWGFYPEVGSYYDYFKSEFPKGRPCWESLSFKVIDDSGIEIVIDDFDTDTDKGSALIIKSLENSTLREEMIKEIIERIVKKTKEIAELIYQKRNLGV